MNPGAIELQEIQVDNACQSVRCQCWAYNIADQFPINSISEISGNMIVEVGPPHEGYTIETTVINKKINGKSKIISPDKVMIASLVFVDGVASGPCKLYDEMGILYFKGYLENGLRQGRGTEYDENRKKVFDGFYEKGKKRKIVPMDNHKQYWIEYDENDDIINIGQRDINGQLKGKCYFYRNNGEISRISKWDEGKELNVIKEFIGNKMIEYKNGVRFYEGCYRDSFDLDYFYEGEGKEYGADGQTLMFHGNYYKGKRHGKGLVYKNMRVNYSCYWYNGCIVNCDSIFKMVIIISYLITIHLIVTWCMSFGRLWYIFLICIIPMAFLVVMPIPLLAYLIYFCITKDICRNRDICKANYSNLRNKTYKKGVAYTRPLNDTETIDIFDECFPFASEFRIDGLNRLKTIKIGNNSFTQEKNSWGNYRSKSFHILNCESLESIQIGACSFSDFAGEFELKNLPQLRSIQIGTIGRNGWNIYGSSFVIRGIDMILNIVMIRSSKSTIHYIRCWCIL